MSFTKEPTLPEKECSELEYVLHRVLGDDYVLPDNWNGDLKEIERITGYKFKELSLTNEDKGIDELEELKTYEEGMELSQGDRVLIPVYVTTETDGKICLNAGGYPYVENQNFFFVPKNLQDLSSIAFDNLRGRKIYVIAQIEEINGKSSYAVSLESPVIVPPIRPTQYQLESFTEKARKDWEEYISLRDRVDNIKTYLRNCVLKKEFNKARELFALARRYPLLEGELEYINNLVYKMPEKEQPLVYGNGILGNRIDSIFGNYTLVESFNEEEFCSFALLVLGRGIPYPKSESHVLISNILTILKYSNIDVKRKTSIILNAIDSRISILKLFENVDEKEFVDFDILYAALMNYKDEKIALKLYDGLLRNVDKVLEYKHISKVPKKYLHLLSLTSGYFSLYLNKYPDIEIQVEKDKLFDFVVHLTEFSDDDQYMVYYIRNILKGFGPKYRQVSN